MRGWYEKMKKNLIRSLQIVFIVAAVTVISSLLPGKALAQRMRTAPERFAPPPMMSFPGNRMRVMIGNRPYFFHNGYFYRPWRGRYYLYRPPFGARLRFIPYGLWSFWIGPALYYYGGGVYYQYIPGENAYVVVPKPQQAPTPANSDEDILYMTNGKTVSGVFMGATPDSIRMQVKDSLQTVPITEIKSINFAPSSFKEKK